MKRTTAEWVRKAEEDLVGFAVTTRYPGDNAHKRDAEASFRWALKVREVARELLGIPPKKTKTWSFSGWLLTFVQPGGTIG